MIRSTRRHTMIGPVAALAAMSGAASARGDC